MIVASITGVTSPAGDQSLVHSAGEQVVNPSAQAPSSGGLSDIAKSPMVRGRELMLLFPQLELALTSLMMPHSNLLSPEVT